MVCCRAVQQHTTAAFEEIREASGSTDLPLTNSTNMQIRTDPRKFSYVYSHFTIAI